MLNAVSTVDGCDPNVVIYQWTATPSLFRHCFYFNFPLLCHCIFNLYSVSSFVAACGTAIIFNSIFFPSSRSRSMLCNIFWWVKTINWFLEIVEETKWKNKNRIRPCRSPISHSTHQQQNDAANKRKEHFPMNNSEILRMVSQDDILSAFKL